MAARTLPNLGLTAFFTLGEDGWDDEMSLNLLKLSVLAQGNVISVVSATPGAPTNGDVHIFDATHPTEPNKVAIRDDGAWIYVTPVEGWMLYDKATNDYMQFDGAAWVVLTMGGGGGASKYRVGFFITGTPTANEVLAMHVFTDAVTFADEFAGAYGLIATNPTATFTITVKKITAALVTTTVGTISISTSGVATFATSGTTVSFDPGDAVTFTAQAGVDATFANAAFTIKEN